MYGIILSDRAVRAGTGWANRAFAQVQYSYSYSNRARQQPKAAAIRTVRHKYEYSFLGGWAGLGRPADDRIDLATMYGLRYSTVQ